MFSSETCARKKPEAAPENRVGDFFSVSYSCAGKNQPQALEPHQAFSTTSTTTVSGVVYWLSKDPIGISGGLNLYVFCGNNPVNFVDPFGLSIVNAIGPTLELIEGGNPFNGQADLTPEQRAAFNEVGQRNMANQTYPPGTIVVIDPLKPPNTVPPKAPIIGPKRPKILPQPTPYETQGPGPNPPATENNNGGECEE